jgi:DNA-binding GntR family transcriptional regulator
MTKDRKTPKKLSAQIIYERLREMILSFELYPGSRVTESDLAEYFSVSRTPIREALRRLELEGALTIRPKQGCFIRSLDIVELTSYYRVRIALESLSLHLACMHMSDRELQKLADAWDPAHQPERCDDAEIMMKRDESFHIALARGGGNQALANYLSDINNHIQIIRRLDFTNNVRIDVTYQEHHAIIQCLLERDYTKARQKMKRHIEKSEEFAKNLTLTQLAVHRKKTSLLHEEPSLLEG